MTGEELYAMFNQSTFDIDGVFVSTWEALPNNYKAIWDNFAKRLDDHLKHEFLG